MTRNQTGEYAAVTRIDSHCHSSASRGAAAAVLGAIGCAECYSPPEQVYDLAARRGMDLFTLTDHDTIDGCLELLERGFPRVILGQEVTVDFPEDRCRLHVLVWGLTPDQHEQIGTLRLRNDVYQFAAWLHQHQLPHALAHPIYMQNHKLTAWHLERCALLFKGVETLNGAHSGTHRSAIDTFLNSLTPGRMHRLIETHGLEPLWPRIWEKATTGGSDDHGLLNVGRTWTQVSAQDAAEARAPQWALDERGRVADAAEFFRIVMSGRGSTGGEAGHSSLLAHQFMAVGARYLAQRAETPGGAGTPTARAAASPLLRFAGVTMRTPSKLRLGVHLLKRRLARRRRPLSPLLGALRTQLPRVLAAYPTLADAARPGGWAGGCALSHHDEMARFADDLHAAIYKALAPGVLAGLRRRSRRQTMDHLASLAVVELAQLPYLFSLFHQNKERTFVEQLEHEYAPTGSGRSVLERPMRVALFTDTLGDVNGVSRFIRNAGEQAARSGRDLRILTSTNFECPQAEYIENFEPLMSMRMPKYEHLELVMPPLTRILRSLDRHQPDVIHVSTPGPVGVVGLIAAKMLRAPVVGVYHTDFPAYVERLFEDDSLAHVTSLAMRWFYSPFRSIFTRSEDYVESIARLGIPRERVLPLRPGIMTAEFHPGFRDEGAAREAGLTPGAVRALFVGRVSVEKNLPFITGIWKRAWSQLAARGIAAELVVIGDGPYRETMERQLRGCGVKFLGFRYGEELSRLYASCDFFVFPSITDTLGQVVMESQGSGLPALVTDVGGPKEVVKDGVTGLVLPARDEAAWVRSIVDLASDQPRRERMGRAAHEYMQEFAMEQSFEHFWSVHEAAWRESLAAKGIRPRAAEPGAAARTPEPASS